MLKRQDTKLESEGAEFLVLGRLLIEGVSCYKAYVNFPGYDLVATNPATGRLARVQVKSRWATDYDRSFPLRSFDCDFVVHVALNRGNHFRKSKSDPGGGVSEPVFYVFPIGVAQAARTASDSWGKVRLIKIPDVESYRSKWGLIRDFLRKPKRRKSQRHSRGYL